MENNENELGQSEKNEKNSSSRSGKKILAAILLSPFFLLPTCVVGFFGGTQLVMQTEIADGGKRIIDRGETPSHFYVLVQDTSQGTVAVKRASTEDRYFLMKTVTNDPNLTFLLENKSGNYGTGKIHDISGNYTVEQIDQSTQRIVVHWDEMDDMSGVCTYVATNETIKPERYGIVWPGMMGGGFLVGIGLVLFCIAIGRPLKFNAVSPSSSGYGL